MKAKIDTYRVFVQNIKNEICNPLKDMIKHQTVNAVQFAKEHKRLEKDYKVHWESLDKVTKQKRNIQHLNNLQWQLKKSYQASFKLLDQIYIERDSLNSYKDTSPEKKASLAKKVANIEKESKEFEQKYMNKVQEYNDFINKYHRELVKFMH